VTGELRRRLWRDLPLLIFAFTACGIAYAEVATLEPPWRDLVATAVFPLAVPVAVYALRWRGADRLDRRLGVDVVAVALALAGASLLWAPRAPLPSAQLRGAYEILSLVNAACGLLHAWSADRARLAWPARTGGALYLGGGSRSVT
jgi:hypothetical protein